MLIFIHYRLLDRFAVLKKKLYENYKFKKSLTISYQHFPFAIDDQIECGESSVFERLRLNLAKQRIMVDKSGAYSYYKKKLILFK